VRTKVVGPTGIAGAGTNRYFYDRADRLVGWRRYDNATTGYVYDNNGNRTSNGTTSATYDQRNRMLTNGATTYSWAPRGVLASTVTGATTTTYGFDAFGRMTTSGTVGFAYDALGRAATRTVGAATTGFSYSGASGEPTGDGTNVYTRTPDGGVLSVAQGATKLFAQVDRHGDVTATLTSAGAVSSSKAYDPYGVVAASAGTTAPSVGFQGDYTDPSSGLVNMGARWYQPSSGGFVSRDTYSGRLDSPVTLNRYTYANNNPLAMFDPTGHAAMTVDGGGYGSSKPKAKPKSPKVSDEAHQRKDDNAAAVKQIVAKMRNDCIARGDGCKTDYNNTAAFTSQALKLAVQYGSYTAAAAAYAPAPPPPPPPIGAGNFSNSDGIKIGVPADLGMSNAAALSLLQDDTLGPMLVGLLDIGLAGGGDGDGNISSQDIEALTNVSNTIELIGKMLPDMSPQDVAKMARNVTAVAQGLNRKHNSWEGFDVEYSWWERNGGKILAVASVVVAVTALVATGGAAIAGSGALFGVAGQTFGTVAIGSSYLGFGIDSVGVYNACGQGNGSCEGALTTFGIGVATFGVAKLGKALTGVELVNGASKVHQARQLEAMSNVVDLSINGVGVGAQVVALNGGFDK
jgi:RHS repeat-associated protein